MKNFPDLHFIDDRLSSLVCVNEAKSGQTLIWANDESLAVRFMQGRLKKKDYLNYVLQQSQNPLVVCDFAFFKQWLDESGIPNVLWPDQIWVDDAVTCHLLGVQAPFAAHYHDHTAFVSLNRRPNEERRYMLKVLHEFDLIKHGYVTDNSISNVRYHGVRYTNNLAHIRPIYPETLQEKFQGIDCSSNFLNCVYINQNIPGNVVLQCNTVLDFYYPTEKWIQAFLLRRIPLTLACSGFVQRMRDMGFDVYDDLIDHSYDSVQDNLQRIRSAIAANQQLLSTAADMSALADRTEKNYRHLVDHAWKYRVQELIMGIRSQIV